MRKPKALKSFCSMGRAIRKPQLWPPIWPTSYSNDWEFMTGVSNMPTSKCYGTPMGTAPPSSWKPDLSQIMWKLIIQKERKVSPLLPLLYYNHLLNPSMMTELLLAMTKILRQLLSAWINFIINEVNQFRNKA